MKYQKMYVKYQIFYVLVFYIHLISSTRYHPVDSKFKDTESANGMGRKLSIYQVDLVRTKDAATDIVFHVMVL